MFDDQKSGFSRYASYEHMRKSFIHGDKAAALLLLHQRGKSPPCSPLKYSTQPSAMSHLPAEDGSSVAAWFANYEMGVMVSRRWVDKAACGR